MNQEDAIHESARVSVIIPAYNAAPFIKETLDSVFAQTYKNFEVIVVNDGSPDTPALEKILAAYCSRIVYIQQENRGPSAARNTGLKAAASDLVAFLDADDIWLPNYLEVQTKFLHDHPEYDLVYCNAKFFGDSIHDGTEYMNLCASEGEATAIAILMRRCHVFTSITARRAALASVLYDESLRTSEDFDCWIRFAASGHRIGYHRKVLVHYRKHGASLSASRARMSESGLHVLDKSLALWPPDAPEYKQVLATRAKRTAELEILRGKIALNEHRIPEAVTHFQQANLFYKTAKLTALITSLRTMPALVRSFYRLRGSIFRAYRT
ncbi:MAG: glycosyltransferase family 2 protein [Acidobacteriaceae bacterium]|nr:glycosyltransferase family 2 protein [Acidobacteriaceae bacterium]